MSNDANARRILPQASQSAQMSSFAFAPQQQQQQQQQQQYPQRETQKNYVFVDEHNRHKRLKVMRACEGCRRRKIKCDAATNNTWPCSSCIRLKLHCVRPNGYEGSADASGSGGSLGQSDQFQQMTMPPQQQAQQQGQQPMMQAAAQVPKAHRDMYANQGYPDASQAAYQAVSYDPSQQPNLGYHTPVPPPTVSVMDASSYAAQANVFPTPPLQPNQIQEPSPDAYSTPDSYTQQQDLSELLGNLKVDEKGTAPYLRNKASFRREEAPAVEDEEDFSAMLPPVTAGPGSKIRIPPDLMPAEEDSLSYIEAFFAYIHPYVPVLNKATFFHQWYTSRESISPLILEAIFAMGGRLCDDPSDGQQWLALASRHADSFMDIPRLSTLQGLLLLLKAREAAPKRGYYYRSWMTVVQCVQMGIDLGLDEHFEDHEAGRGCDHNPADCHLRTRIWNAVFVCEVMVGAPQGRHDLSVPIDSVDFSVPQLLPGADEHEYHTSRNFVYLARVVHNVRKLGSTYMRVRKKKDWGIDPEVQQLNRGFDNFLAELPADLAVNFPADGSPPWIPSAFVGNMHSYYHLTLILFHRPQLSFFDPGTNPQQWKHHMLACYESAKALCRLQEAVINMEGLEGLQSMQRGYSFTVYAGLSCIVLHLIAIVSPDPDLNSDAIQFFTRHMRIMEKVMEVWPMPELRQQVEAVREAFSADTRRAFVLKPSFPYGSPRLSNSSSPPQDQPQSYRRPPNRLSVLDQHMAAAQAHQNVSYAGHPISPPVSTGAMDSKGDSPAGQPLVMMSQGGQGPGVQQNMSIADHPAWNPSKILEQWNTTFGTPPPSDTGSFSQQARPLNLSPSAGASEMPSIPEYPGANDSGLASSDAQISPQQYQTANIPNFVTPAMWQESVASVYEGGLKRGWDFDDGSSMMKRR